MKIETPTHNDYDQAITKISRHFLNDQSSVFSIYGSGWKPYKRRVPVSDLDIFIIELKKELPSFESTQAFGEVLTEIHPNIPIQMTWLSEQILKSPLCPQKLFLDETKGCSEGNSATSGYSEYINRTAQELYFKNDDITMMTHFIRKIVSQTVSLQITKQKKDLEQTVKLFGAYRKIFGLMSLLIRIKSRISPFSKDKSEIIDSSQEILGYNLILNKQLILTLDQEDPNYFIRYFHSAKNEEVLDYFSQLYDELMKIITGILHLPIKKKVEEILSF